VIEERLRGFVEGRLASTRWWYVRARGLSADERQQERERKSHDDRISLPTPEVAFGYARSTTLAFPARHETGQRQVIASAVSPKK
jgi:hypothetical protein